MTAFRVHVVSLALLVCTAVGAAASTLAFLKFAENKWMPVLVDWTPAGHEVRGLDVIVHGTQRKVRDCVFVPPIRAVGPTGRHLVVTSMSPTSGQNWRPDEAPREFGPWAIAGGAGGTVHLYAEHQCHLLWSVFSDLGTLTPER